MTNQDIANYIKDCPHIEHIDSIVIGNQRGFELLTYIVIKLDTIEIRSDIFDFMEKSDCFEFIVQFVPISLKNRITGKVIFENGSFAQ